MRNFLTYSLLAAGLASLVSCGGNGSVADDLGAIVGEFQILDLATGTVEARAAVPDLTTNADYRTTKIVFRAVSGGSVTIGSDVAGFGAQVDEVQSGVTVSRFYMAVFETTRDQWTLIAGTTPWTGFSSSLVGSANNELPACGLSKDQVTAALQTYNAGKVDTVALPTNVQWEYACRAGTTSTFSWGEDRSDLTVETYAIVSETAAGQSGPRVVGGRAANGFGLFDMHGNVWEMTTSDNIRGGSWRDTLPMARSANHLVIDQTTSHPLVGVRLILVR